MFPHRGRVSTVRAFVGVFTAAILAVATLVGIADVPPAAAADLSQFRPGNIISDAVFFDSASMSADQIQAFLESKVPRCDPGYTCLRDKYDTTRSTPTDAMCSAYQGGGSERASSIIAKVATACGINPQVLIVMLQKEQGLTTHTWPSDWRYTIAMGQGCPDTAACDTVYYGFFNQVYGAARQLKRYANPPGTSAYFTWFAPGNTWNIQWNPNAGCGSGRVYIENQATADLYYYTPYQPNAAALRAGYGEGDGCSAYGNRNFFQYFTDWFGSTQARSGDTAIAATAAADPWLGSATTPIICGLVRGGCFQDYQNGKIHWSPTSGAHATRGGIQAMWARSGWENGALGYPVSEENCGLPASGCYQDFQNGKVYWSPATDAQPVLAGMAQGWGAIGWERGRLGYPVAAETCDLPGGGCQQSFQGGLMVWTPRGGAHATSSDVLAAWTRLGGAGSHLGEMTGNIGCGLPGGGCYQDFAGGSIHWSSASGAHATWGGIRVAWGRSGWEGGPLGYPLGEEVCAAAGCSQDFQRGRMYWSSDTDAHFLLGGMLQGFEQTGGVAGKLGYPTTNEACGLPEAGCYQVFEGGLMYWTAASGAHGVLGGVLGAWSRDGYERGSLGYPTGEETCGLAGGGCVQDFEHGRIYWSAPTDARIVQGDILLAYEAAGGPSGRLGYPVADSSCDASGGCTQAFQGGVLP